MRLLFAALLAAMPAASAIASPGIGDADADVLGVDPLYETVRIFRLRESCREEPTASRDDPGRAAGGAVVGAIIGGAVGSQIGSGRGRRAATAAGVVAAAVTGSQAARADQPAGDEYEPRCRLVEAREEERRIVGCGVERRYRGRIFPRACLIDPGERLRIRITVEPAEWGPRPRAALCGRAALCQTLAPAAPGAGHRRPLRSSRCRAAIS